MSVHNRYPDIDKNDSVLEVFRLLRYLGKKSKKYCSSDFNFQYNQFNAVAIVSQTEVDRGDLRFIVEPRNTLEHLVSGKISDSDKFICKYSCIILERTAIILNLKEPNIHGEARLLDSYGELRSRLGLHHRLCAPDPINILDHIKSHYYRQFSRHEPYFIFLFSFYIPCTLKNHNCVKLVDMFTTERNDHIIISHEDVYWDTMEKEALKILFNSPNIIYINPQSFIQMKMEDDLDTYLMPFDDEEPTFSRRTLIRRRKIRKRLIYNLVHSDGKNRKTKLRLPIFYNEEHRENCDVVFKTLCP